MNLGFTGTRHPITPVQREWLRNIMLNLTPDEVHHGACVNADEECHDICLELEIPVKVHPPKGDRLMMPREKWRSDLVEVLWHKAYLDRNRDIVDASDELIALPDGPERPNGGTWYTVRYAVSKGVPVTICYPDGTVEKR